MRAGGKRSDKERIRNRTRPRVCCSPAISQLPRPRSGRSGSILLLVTGQALLSVGGKGSVTWAMKGIGCTRVNVRGSAFEVSACIGPFKATYQPC